MIRLARAYHDEVHQYMIGCWFLQQEIQTEMMRQQWTICTQPLTPEEVSAATRCGTTRPSSRRVLERRMKTIFSHQSHRNMLSWRLMSTMKLYSNGSHNIFHGRGTILANESNQYTKHITIIL
jgi:hypothetical protein